MTPSFTAATAASATETVSPNAATSATATVPRHDVVILGGGLAGLTLALQLRQRFADIDVLVLERKPHPVPLAAHKVGESSVEIGAHYFESVLGLRDHLQQQQLRKFGFRFFFSEGRRDIQNVTELGASKPLPVASYQIDRGIFENHLAQECQRRGLRFVDQAVVRKVELADAEDKAPATADATAATALHTITWQQAGGPPQQVQARWVIDASGRAGLLKRQLQLEQDNAHQAHAVWFRISEHIGIDGWNNDADWQARCATPTRWLSTNHMVGAGYWVWLIPLASGSHSVGIVADPAYHPLDSMNTFDKAMAWLETYQPSVFDDLQQRLDPAQGGSRDKLQDFCFFRNFSYDCKQVFSANRWALTGEAGRFLDPFYSPGSDFIAIGNTYITELIARDRAGQRLGAHTQVFEQIFKSFYDSTLQLYTGQYGLFGDAEVMPAKVIWDYTYYWGVLAQFFFQNRLADMAALSHLRAELADCQALNTAVQALLQAWGAASDNADPARNPRRLLDQASMPWFAELNGALQDTLDDAGFRARIRGSTRLLRALAAQIAQRALGEQPQLDVQALRALAGADLEAAAQRDIYGELLFAAAPGRAPARLETDTAVAEAAAA